MDHVDRVASRVSLCAIVGLGGGSFLAAFRGYPLQSTAIKVASSCAIVATSLFASERVAYVVLKHELENERRLVLTSHAFAGVMGGGLNGYLYHRQPVRGMFVFVPIMVGVSFLEMEWQRRRQARIQAIQEECNPKQ